jgi:hypothetical protein
MHGDILLIVLLLVVLPRRTGTNEVSTYLRLPGTHLLLARLDIL